MAEAKDAKRKPRRHPRSSSLHLIAWTQNGEPMPESVQRKLEQAVEAAVVESETPLLHTTRRI